MKQLNYISQLVFRAKKGEVSAMRDLYEKFAKEMISASCRITQNLKDSEDILQDSFLKAFEKLDTLNEPAHFGGWLKRIVINNSLNLVKSRIHFTEIEMVSDFSEDKNEDWFRDIPFDKIRDEIQNLPEGCRQIFTLFLLENYKHREIAEMLNISISNSKSQYRYALKLLKGKLQKYLIT